MQLIFNRTKRPRRHLGRANGKRLWGGRRERETLRNLSATVGALNVISLYTVLNYFAVKYILSRSRKNCGNLGFCCVCFLIFAGCRASIQSRKRSFTSVKCFKCEFLIMYSHSRISEVKVKPS